MSDKIPFIECINSSAFNFGIAASIFYPPSFECVQCSLPMRKSSKSQFAVLYFSVHSSSLIAYASSLLCDCKYAPCIFHWITQNIHCAADCQICHYHDYYVVNDQQIYYNGISIRETLQYEHHKFIDAELCELFTSLMVFTW